MYCDFIFLPMKKTCTPIPFPMVVFFPVKLLNDDFTPNIHQITAVVSFFKTIFTLSSLYLKLSFLPSLCISKSGGYYMILSDYQFFHCFD